jgi:hypothetical protein
MKDPATPMFKYCAHVCVNGKMTPVETIPEMGGGGYKGE